LIFNLIFDVILGGWDVNRRRAGEESKGEKISGWNGRKRCFDHGHDRRNVQRSRRLNYLDSEMRSRAEGTIRTGDITVWMNVNGLNRSAGDDQRDAQEREDELPRTLSLRL
jgi:hypothetical protein